jgi:hypothetical protein
VPVGLGPRFLIEAGFIIAVAVVAGLARLGTATIILVMAAAWLIVAVVEWLAARSRQRESAARIAAQSAGSAAVTHEAAVPASAPVVLQPTEPPPQPMPKEAPPEEPAGEPATAAPPLAAVPEPELEPDLVADAPAPEPAVVALDTRRSGPREWNLWDLERLARARSGGDAVRDEERSFLLMYLREFANADGVLPADFDAVVRESFGDVLDPAPS